MNVSFLSYNTKKQDNKLKHHTSISYPLPNCFFKIHNPNSPLPITNTVSIINLLCAYLRFFSNLILCLLKLLVSSLKAPSCNWVRFLIF